MNQNCRGIFFFALCLAVAAFAQGHADGQVVIHEIMFRAAPAIPEDPGKEWIELHNAAAEPVNLAGWRLSQGVSFPFTNVSIPAGGFLVVAANVQKFQTAYPEVTNVVGNWTGKLRNNGEEIQLENAAGETVDKVQYRTEGDWALRRPGDPYPGRPEWWPGWKWHCPADGEGKSLELLSPALPNEHGQSWAFSLAEGGTPGRANSVLTLQVAPLVLEVRHAPAIPRSTHTVAVTARILPGLGAPGPVTLFHRVDGEAAFASTPMLDNGLSGDGLRGDGVYGARLPARQDKTVVEFFVETRDEGEGRRTWPGPTDEAGTQGANALYQVDDFASTGSQPIYRFIVTAREWSEWVNLMDYTSSGRYSNARMNAAVVRIDGGGTETRYQAALRNRGAGTRAARPHNLSLGLPADHDLRGIRRLDFNTRTVHSQVAGNAIFSAAGLLNAYGTPVQVRINGQNLANAMPDGRVDSFQFGSYYCFEPYTGDWGPEHVPQDPDGNIYKGVWYFDNVGLVHGATLDYLGSDPEAYRLVYGPTGPVSTSGPYQKDTNQAEDDWSDLIQLTYALSANTPDEEYLGALERHVHVEQWLRHIAAHSLLLNMETCLATGAGDDYSCYRGMMDPRFQLLPHDLDTVLGAGENAPSWNRSIFKAADLPVLNRFLKHPAIAPRYFSNLVHLADTVFREENLNALLDQQLGGWVPASYIDAMKAAGRTRRANVLAQVPLTLTATSDLPLTQGYPRTTASTVALSGSANAVRTRAVTANGVPATYTPWQGAWSVSQVPLNPGLNRVLVRAFDAAGKECGRTWLDIWSDRGAGMSVGGNLAADATWEASQGPFEITSNLTVPNGVTLRILPGTTVFLGAGVNLVVASGGRLLAEGSPEAPIRFATKPGGAAWGGLTLNGGPGSPETRIAHAHFEGNGTKCIQATGATLYLGHTSFGTATRQYLSLDASSFLVEHCTFPTGSGQFELVHGSQGIKPGGRGVFHKCFFGAASGYNDVIDFTGGNRDAGEPILQVVDCVFVGSGDDLLDLDGTDAWVEGNVFLNVHRNGAPDSSSAVSGGSDGTRTSEVTVLRNLFYNCDHAVTAKQGNFYTLLQNTIVRTTKTGGQDTGSAVVNLRDTDPTPTTFGRGVYLEGNVILDAEELVRNYDPAQTTVTFTNNLLPVAWTGPGGGNLVGDPQLRRVPTPEETRFQNWQEAQVMWEWLGLKPGSPARGLGVAGEDLGGVIPTGIRLAGVPAPITASSALELRPGPAVVDASLPSGGFPSGSGYTHYRWRLDAGPWSNATPVAMPLTLSGLVEGPHQLEVSGQRDSGSFQDDPVFAPEGQPTVLRWQVDRSRPSVRLNEILADNRGAAPIDDTAPDLVELYNAGAAAVDLSGMSLSDTLANPARYVFPLGTTLEPGGYRVVVADANPGHTGFGLAKSGGGVYLFDAPSRGGTLLDQVVYGAQLPDLSIGRLANGEWGLMPPTFGGPNGFTPVGDPAPVRINEWLAASATAPDFIELFNPESAPVNLGGCFLSDAPAGQPGRNPIPPLTFIPARGFLVWVADGLNAPGHVGFKLAQEWGAIGLFGPNLEPIDQVVYGAQSSEVSTGRSPDGSAHIQPLTIPTPGAGNPYTDQFHTVTEMTVALMDLNHIWYYNQTENLDGVTWSVPSFDDSAWPTGPGLLAHEDDTDVVPLVRTTLNDPRDTVGEVNSGHAFYFRTVVEVTNDLSGYTLQARLRVDDGAVLYINGAEVLRHRMRAAEVITNTSFATGTPATGDAVADELVTIPGGLLRPGPNVIAAQAHQANATSSDIVWGLALSASKLVTNWTQVQVVLSEVLARNRSLPDATGVVADWLELHNPGGVPADLSEMRLKVEAQGAAKEWAFPSGLALAPGAYLLVACNPDLPASTNGVENLNTGFGLEADGAKLFLYKGAGLIDAVSFGPQAADLSISRSSGNGGPWGLSLPTPGSAPILAQTAAPTFLRINEWMANPKGGEDWFELHNASAQPIALGGLSLTDDLNRPRQFVIAPLSYLGSGLGGGYLRFHADSTPTNGPTHTTFKLSASGESIGLFGTDGVQLLDAVTFGPQKEGVSEGRFPDGSETIVTFPRSPTPGAANYVPFLDLQISEALPRPSAGGQTVELYNQSEQTADLSGAWFSDDLAVPQKYRLPDPTILAPGDFLVLAETEFNPQPGNSPSFALKPDTGGALHLSVAAATGELTGRRATLTYGVAEADVSQGVYETSTGPQSTTLSARTLGGPNPAPRVGPVVISELHYHPPNVAGADNLVDEFLELANVSETAVPLFDPAHPAQTWGVHAGVSFDFPSGTWLPPGGLLVLVSFDPVLDESAASLFRQRFALPAEVPLFGPWRGKLDNGGEGVTLDRPFASPEGVFARVVMDRVDYTDEAPWPSAADGTGLGLGFSLQKRGLTAFGNDPVNWVVAVPTPGRANGLPPAALPVVTQPPAHVTLPPGSTATFAAAATGALPLHYQWCFQGMDLPGETNASLALPSITEADEGRYAVRVSNPFGAMLSPAARLRLQAAPVFTRQPSGGTASAGALLAAVVHGTAPIQYQWYRNGQPLAGAQQTTLRLDDPEPGEYYLTAANVFGSATSVTITLTEAEPDADQDGIPDAWLTLHFGHSTGQEADQSRAGDDPDQDGLSNLDEYRAGTLPKDASSVLRLEVAPPTQPGQYRLRFQAVANRGYRLQHRTSFGTVWADLMQIPAGPARTVEAELSAQAAATFYRIVTSLP